MSLRSDSASLRRAASSALVRSIVLLCLGLLSGVTPLLAAPESTPASSSSSNEPATSAYVDRPTSDYSSSFGPPSLFWSDSSPWRGGPWGVPPHWRYPRPAYTRTEIYFPPVLPALGDPLPGPAAGSPDGAPAALAAFLGENFYAPLSSELWENDLPKRTHARVERYRLARDAAADALRTTLRRLSALPAAERASALAAFAAEQAPALGTLEAEAESIRSDLVHGFFNSAVHWNRSRDWRLGDNLRWESDVDEFKVMRGAIFYESGLSLEQRDLLREIVYELIDTILHPHAPLDLGAPRPALHLPPGAARVRLPLDLPAELAALIERYRDERHALKSELRRTVYEKDRSFGPSRRAAFRALAAAQAPAFAALEARAEEIRAGLVQVPGVMLATPGPTVPAALAQRIETYVRTKLDLQNTITARLDDLRSRHDRDRFELVRLPVGYGIALTPHRGRHDVTALQQEIEAFNDAQRTRFEQLATERDTIERDVRAHAQQQLTRAPGRPLDALLHEFNESYAQQERWKRYEDYQTAMLLPGLSPAQRRVLFNASLSRLELPLTGQ